MQVRRILSRAALLAAVTTTGALALAATGHAASVTQTGTTLEVLGDATADDFDISQTSATDIVIDAAAVDLTEAGDNCAIAADGDGGDNVACTVATWTALSINSGDGDDEISLGGSGGTPVLVPATIRAGAGYDDVDGGSGADSIDLEANSGTADGHGGNDTLTGTVAGPDSMYLNGGAGDDVLDLTKTPTGSSSNGSGDDGNDTITGGAGDGFFNGGSGADTLTGGTGNEYLLGGTGSDTINGGAGDDTLGGGDTLTDVPAPGFDTYTSDGPDSISGGDGADTVNYQVRTAAVVVDLQGTTGQGEAGENDTIAADVEHVTGGRGADTLTGDEQANALYGNSGNDVIDGKGGFDQLAGDGDADTINAGGDVSPDLVMCGASFQISATAIPVGTDADVANLDYVDVLDPFADCETVNRAKAPALAPLQGTSGNDTITGDSLPNFILGLGGIDRLRGLAGNDEILGNGGNDKIWGGPGNDNLDGGAGNDAVLGEAGSDLVEGGIGNDGLNGGPGADSLNGGLGIDRLDGGLGKDFLVSRDNVRDIVTCTKVNLRVRAQRAQRDVVIADRRDLIRNRAWCASVTVLA